MHLLPENLHEILSFLRSSQQAPGSCKRCSHLIFAVRITVELPLPLCWATRIRTWQATPCQLPSHAHTPGDTHVPRPPHWNGHRAFPAAGCTSVIKEKFAVSCRPKRSYVYSYCSVQGPWVACKACETSFLKQSGCTVPMLHENGLIAKIAWWHAKHAANERIHC